MSYHQTHYSTLPGARVDLHTRLTSDQLDRMADNSISERSNVAAGGFWFVDYGVANAKPDGRSEPWFDFLGVRAGGPFDTIEDGIEQAGPKDVVLIRSVRLGQSLRITKPCTVRATRGDVVIGKP